MNFNVNFRRRAFKICNEYFHQFVLPDQNILGEQKHWDKLLALVPNEGTALIIIADLRLEFSSKWRSGNDSVKKWKDLLKGIERTAAESVSLKVI